MKRSRDTRARDDGDECKRKERTVGPSLKRQRGLAQGDDKQQHHSSATTAEVKPVTSTGKGIGQRIGCISADVLVVSPEQELRPGK